MSRVGSIRAAWYMGPMNERVKKLSEEIRKFSPEEQADLVDEVLANLHGAEPGIEKAWAEEAERRWQAHLRNEGVDNTG